MGSPNMCHRLFVCFGIIKKVLGSAMRDGIRNGDVAWKSISAWNTWAGPSGGYCPEVVWLWWYCNVLIAFCCLTAWPKYTLPKTILLYRREGFKLSAEQLVIHFMASALRSCVVISNSLPGSSCIMHLFIWGITLLCCFQSSSSPPSLAVCLVSCCTLPSCVGIGMLHVFE